MDRIEFCNELTKSRELQCCGKNELCRRTGFTFYQLQRIEGAIGNFKMELAFRYLKGIRYELVIENDSNVIAISDYENLVSWLIDLKEKSGALISKIVDSTGFSRTSISKAFNRSRTITIDLLLAVCSMFDCTVTIRKAE